MRMLHGHGRKWLGIVLLFFIPLIALHLVEKQITPLENAYQSTTSDFQYKGSDGVWRDFDPNMSQERVTGTYWFKTVLPENRWRDPYMYLVFVHNAHVYLDGKLIYTFTPLFEYWEHPHLIELPEDFSGKTLMIRIDFDRQLMYPGVIFIDSPLHFIIKFFMQNDYRLLLGLISLLVSITGFSLYIGRRQPSYLYFSLFALYIAQLCASRSWFLLGLLAPSPAFAYFQDVMLAIGGYCFLRFYENLSGTAFKRIHGWLSKMMIIMFVILLITAISFPSIYRNEMSTIIQNIISPSVMIFILVSSMYTYWKQKDTESFWLMAGIVTFGISTLLYLLFPYIYWSIEQIFPKWFYQSILYQVMYYGDRFLHGIFILLFCMAMVLRTRIRNVYGEAQRTATELKKLSNTLEQLVQERTKELERTNQNLRSSMKKTAEALAEVAVLEDRNRIAQDMHDRTGHALTAALIQIEAAKLLVTKDTAKTLEKLEATRESVSSGLESIRETVRMMKLDYEERSLVISIQQLIRETENAVGVQVYYIPEPLPDLDPILKKTIYLALQEGLTNGIRHGKAKDFEFSLKLVDDIIHFHLCNNGEPYENQQFGFGLNTMRDRIERLNGTIELKSTDEHACVLSITLPIKQYGDEEE